MCLSPGQASRTSSAKPIAIGLLAPFGTQGDGERARRHRHAHRSAAELYPEGEPVELLRHPRIESQDPVADVDSGVRVLQEIERARHDPQVNAFSGCSALDVTDIAFERDEKALPGRLRVERRERTGVRHEAQGGSMRCALVVVGDVLADGVGTVPVAESLEETWSSSGAKRKKSITVSACFETL